MGNDQSGYQSALADRAAAARSTGAIPRVRTRQDSSLSFQDESGRSSPHPSDGSGGADVPYVSYTVNKPIGGQYQYISQFLKRNSLINSIQMSLRVTQTSGKRSRETGQSWSGSGRSHLRTCQACQGPECCGCLPEIHDE